MLARFFQKSQPISFVSLLFLLFLFITAHYLFPLPVQNSLASALDILAAFLFFVCMLFLVSFIVSKNRLTKANYYSILIFVLLLGLFPSVFEITKVSFSHLFLLLAARRIYSIRSKKMLLSKLFDSGFYIGIAFLLYPQTILFLLLIYASYSIYLKIINKNLLLPIVGFFTPILVVFTYYFVFDKLPAFNSLMEINVGFELKKFTSLEFLLPSLLLLLILIFSLFKILSKALSFDGKSKNSNKLVIAHLVIGLLILFLNNLKLEETIQYLFFPIAVITGKLFYLINKTWIKDIVIYSLLLLAILLPFLPDL